jgi:hypothetical protein
MSGEEGRAAEGDGEILGRRDIAFYVLWEGRRGGRGWVSCCLKGGGDGVVGEQSMTVSPVRDMNPPRMSSMDFPALAVSTMVSSPDPNGEGTQGTTTLSLAIHSNLDATPSTSFSTSIPNTNVATTIITHHRSRPDETYPSSGRIAITRAIPSRNQIRH